MIRKAKSGRERIIRITLLGLFTALILIFGLTPIGYIKIGILEITFLIVPVAMGAIMLGAGAGAFLGLVFGLTSLFQAIFANPIGQLMLNVNAVYAVITFVVTRTLMGFLVGLIALAVKRFNKDTPREILGYGIVTASASLVNSILFLGAIALFFGTNAEVLAGFGQTSVWGVLALIVGTNAIAELVFAIVVGTAVAKAACHVLKKISRI